MLSWPCVDRLAQPPAGGDVQRLADLVQHDPVPGGEQLERAMPGKHVVLELDPAARRSDSTIRIVES